MSDQQSRLFQAITCYEQWQLCLDRLSAVLSGDCSAEFWVELEAAHLTARRADQALLNCLPSAVLESSPAYARYRALVAAVVEQVEALQQRAQTLKALAAAELAELRGGRVAVAGYRPLPGAAASAFTARG